MGLFPSNWLLSCVEEYMQADPQSKALTPRPRRRRIFVPLHELDSCLYDPNARVWSSPFSIYSKLSKSNQSSDVFHYLG